ncbi:MAG: histidine phosphatase family protein [Clostridia bacterium]|nr:histidine phosphatase family protein [Clostridia bacterium]
MAECRFIIERHGQSEGNLRRLFLGHTDLPLSELGEKQALCTAEYLRGEHIDVMITSDLKRAYQTGQALAELKGLPLLLDRQLREIYAGKWEGKSYEEIGRDYPEEYGVWLSDIGNAVCTDGESVRELDQRIFKEICRLGDVYGGKTVFIATHATPIRLLKLRAMGLPLEKAKDYRWVVNASVTEIGYENGKLRIIKDTQSDHLGMLVTQLPSNV